MFTAVAIFGGGGDDGEPLAATPTTQRRLWLIYVKEMVELIHFTIFITALLYCVFVFVFVLLRNNLARYSADRPTGHDGDARAAARARGGGPASSACCRAA